MARKLIVGDTLHIFKGPLVGGLYRGEVVELHGRHHAVVRDADIPDAHHVVVARKNGWESTKMITRAEGGITAASALGRSRAKIHRGIHKQVLFLGVPSEENEGFFASIEGTYQNAIDDMKLKGFWLVCDLDGGQACGWQIGCPDGALLAIPSPETRHEDGTGPAYVDKIVDAFFEAEAHRVASASPAARAA